jgi:hypothetical protein
MHMYEILRNLKVGDAVPDPFSAEEVVDYLFKLCRQSGYTDLRILIDPAINSHWEELAREVERLYIPGVRFNFFLENKSFNQVKQQLPLERFQYIDLKLTRELAELALKFRCEACLKPDVNVNAFSLEGLFRSEIRTQVINSFVQIGVDRQSFREMWRFGNELFNKHLDGNGKAEEKSFVSKSVFENTKELFSK